VSPAFLEKLEAARLALSHSMPGADAVLSAGLDLLLARDAKNKALVERPRTTPATAAESSDPDHIPAAVRREVWERDGGCCRWELDPGGVCGSRLRVQLDHIVPKVSGGKSVTWDLRILCERHNKWAARQKLGHGVMNRHCRDPRRSELLDSASGGGA
jgi:5-methylcytosine-specific restriction endonuclease McrA